MFLSARSFYDPNIICTWGHYFFYDTNFITICCNDRTTNNFMKVVPFIFTKRRLLLFRNF